MIKDSLPDEETKVPYSISYIEFEGADSNMIFRDSKFKLRRDPYKGGIRSFEKTSYNTLQNSIKRLNLKC